MCSLYIGGTGWEKPYFVNSFPGTARIIFHFIYEKACVAEVPFFLSLVILSRYFSLSILYSGHNATCAFEKIKNAVEQ